MTRGVLLVSTVALCACAASPLRDARQMGLARQGRLTASQADLVSLTIEVHDAAPMTLPHQPALVVPPQPAVDADALHAATVDALHGVGITVGATDTTTPPDALAARFRTLLETDVPAALSLTVHIGWCPVDDGWSACVRSPDTALGYGPPAVEGFVYRRFRPKADVATARRVSWIHKGFVYQIDPSGAHLDRPFIGAGDTFQAQAEDAAGQAVSAWLTMARGRRGQRAATAD